MSSKLQPNNQLWRTAVHIRIHVVPVTNTVNRDQQLWYLSSFESTCSFRKSSSRALNPCLRKCGKENANRLYNKNHVIFLVVTIEFVCHFYESPCLRNQQLPHDNLPYKLPKNEYEICIPIRFSLCLI